LELGRFIKDDGTDRKLKYFRSLISTSPFSIEPYIYGAISRYTLGGCIRARITHQSNYELQILRLGNGQLQDHVQHVGGYQQLVLAKAQDILLPGEGFMILIVPKKGSVSPADAAGPANAILAAKE
jgi:hypothetical protein